LLACSWFWVGSAFRSSFLGEYVCKSFFNILQHISCVPSSYDNRVFYSVSNQLRQICLKTSYLLALIILVGQNFYVTNKTWTRLFVPTRVHAHPCNYCMNASTYIHTYIHTYMTAWNQAHTYLHTYGLR
jgi:hypothetical protein